MTIATATFAPATAIDTRENESWKLKDLRKTCATYYDDHVPESSIEILGHSVSGITYRHYAHRGPLGEGDHGATAAISIHGACARLRRSMPVLPTAIRRSIVDAGDGTDAHLA